MSTRYAIMALLDRRPMYGYELKLEFEMEIGNHWSLNFGQVYLTLESLEKQGLVKHRVVPGTDAPDKKVFKLSAAGRKKLAEWFKSPVEQTKGLRDEFYVKFMLGLTSPLIEVEEIVLSQKKFVLQKLHEYTNLKRQADHAGELSRVMLLDLALLRAEAEIRWLEMCEARLEKLKIEKSGMSLEARLRPPGKTPEAGRKGSKLAGVTEE